MVELFQARTVAEAREVISHHLDLTRETREVPLLESLGCRTAAGIPAVEDVPGFDRSVMDGFAVRSEDTFGASDNLPAYLEVVGRVHMGRPVTGSVGKGQAWEIPTGGMLPGGADAVVMLEYSEPLPDGKSIGIIRPAAPGENIVRCGEDVRKGDVVLPEGHIIRPQDMGAMAAAGITQVPAYSGLHVGILSTGDEVVPVEDSPRPGQVRDINSYSLYGQVLQNGGRPRVFGIVEDDPIKLRDRLREAFEVCDIVILSGGSSVGVRDVAAEAISSLGPPGILFHGISIKPGKPTVGAVVSGKPVFGLPGHPVSAMLVFDLLVAPLLRWGEYRKDPLEFPLRARISRSVRSAAGREDYIRVRLGKDASGMLQADPVMGKSALITTMVRANGLVRIPASMEGVEAGEYVEARFI